MHPPATIGTSTGGPAAGTLRSTAAATAARASSSSDFSNIDSKDVTWVDRDSFKPVLLRPSASANSSAGIAAMILGPPQLPSRKSTHEMRNSNLDAYPLSDAVSASSPRIVNQDPRPHQQSSHAPQHSAAASSTSSSKPKFPILQPPRKSGLRYSDAVLNNAASFTAEIRNSIAEETSDSDAREYSMSSSRSGSSSAQSSSFDDGGGSSARPSLGPASEVHAFPGSRPSVHADSRSNPLLMPSALTKAMNLNSASAYHPQQPQTQAPKKTFTYTLHQQQQKQQQQRDEASKKK